MNESIKLYGRVILRADIRAVTGLHIGGAGAALEIGGLDKEVIRNPLSKEPYIPGSSLRGKMRSQLEKSLGLRQNRPIGQVTIHSCKTSEEYEAKGGCPVCKVFGIPAEEKFHGATRLIVRDVNMTRDSVRELADARTDLLYAELKTEVAIDRVTSAASPRTMERVPAGAVFGPAELVFGIYDPADFGRLKTVVNALQLVEDDYLGGAGSRGYGKVAFENLKIKARSSENYSVLEDYANGFGSVQEALNEFSQILDWLNKIILVTK